MDNVFGQSFNAIVLAAGYGTRLKPLTDGWPKCLMPIGNVPLLEYWLYLLYSNGIKNVLVNTHYLSNHVLDFLDRDVFKDWVLHVNEKVLLGTAGTVRENYFFCKNKPLILIHGDNWSIFNFHDFLDFHQNRRPKNALVSMMTFKSDQPDQCGVVEIDEHLIVRQFYEKSSDYHGNLANAAVYILEPEVVQWIFDNPQVSDFSTEVLPFFIGKIATWNNSNIHRDIGTIQSLLLAQGDSKPSIEWFGDSEYKDSWSLNFKKNIINNKIFKLMRDQVIP